MQSLRQSTSSRELEVCPQEMQEKEVTQVQQQDWGRAPRGGARCTGTFAARLAQNARCGDVPPPILGMYVHMRKWEHARGRRYMSVHSSLP